MFGVNVSRVVELLESLALGAIQFGFEVFFHAYLGLGIGLWGCRESLAPARRLYSQSSIEGLGLIVGFEGGNMSV